MTTVLVVDDQVLIRSGLAALIRAAPGLEVVGEAADGGTALALAAQHRPDVVLMDIRMPGADGISVTEQLLAAATEPRPRILILTTFDLDDYVYRALRAGASGFLLKDIPPERLLTAIHVIASGDMLFSPTVTCRLIEAYMPQPAPAGVQPVLDPLTNRELDVLRLVGTGLTNTEIAHRLVLSIATVKTHLNRTMSKLNLASRAQAVVLAYESGLITPSRTEPQWGRGALRPDTQG